MEVLSTVLQKEAQVLELAYPSVIGFQTKFIGNWSVLQIMSGDLGSLGLTQNNCSLNSLLLRGGGRCNWVLGILLTTK